MASEYVQVADKYGLDYRILPIISYLESSGGKHCLYNNCYGYGSSNGLKHFGSEAEAIDYIANQLMNGHYYKGKTLEQKIKIYNSVNPNYYPNFKKLYDTFN